MEHMTGCGNWLDKELRNRNYRIRTGEGNILHTWDYKSGS